MIRRRKGVSLIDRFMAFVIPEPNTGCWLWVGGGNGKGYGKFRPESSGRNMRAHRFAYEHFVGKIPAGMQLDHLCRVRCCVNPQHLEPVTCRENIIRGHAARAASEVL